MATIAAARKSRLHNALEGLALTATLQSFPTFAAAAFSSSPATTTSSATPASPSSSPSPRLPMRCSR